MRRTLCIWLPHWPIQRIAVARPELEHSAILVLYETARGTRRVAHASAAARARGIVAGMPLAEATALEPSLRAEAHDPAADHRALEELAEACRQFSPLVGVEDVPAPQCLWLDLTGLAHLFGSEAALAQRILDDFSSRALKVRLALADTLGAAWALAHGSPAPLAVQIAAPGTTESALAPLPVEALRLPPDVADLLHALGIFRVAQLESLPREHLAARFGPELLRRWDQATGRLAEPIPAQPFAPLLEAGEGLEYPTTRREIVEQIAERLVAILAERLRQSGRGALRLECRLKCQTAAPREACNAVAEVSVNLFRPSALPRHLAQLVRMRLERLVLTGPVAAVTLRAALTAPLDRRQEELFDRGAGQNNRRRLLAGLVDRLASRLGPRAVLRARRLADAQPELAYQYESMVLPRRGAGRSATAWQSPPRPLRLLRRPAPLVVLSALPDGPPAQFLLNGREHRIARVWGPERIETGWWRGPMVGRDYYRVQTTAGQRYWLFRALSDRRWFLHGTFE